MFRLRTIMAPHIAAAFFGFAVPCTLAGQDPPLPLPGQAQPPARRSALDWSLGGYVEDTLHAEYLRGKREGAALNNSRLRLNLSGRVDPRLDFGLTLIGKLNLGTTRFDLGHYLPQEAGGPIIAGAEDLFQFEVENDIYLQEAFGTVYWEHARLRAGRHKFYSGTGFAFNPTDLFNRKDPLDPTYEVDGLDAITGSLILPAQTELQGTVRLGNDFETVDYQAKLQTYLKGWDVGMHYTRHIKRRIDWETLNTPGALQRLARGEPFDSFERDFTWHLIAAQFAGDVRGVGIHGEGGYAFVEEPLDYGTLRQAAEDHERLLVGADYTFRSQLYVIAEYMRIGQGRTRAAGITMNDRLAYMTGEILSINRDTLFAGASYPVTALADLALYGIAGCNDPSMILNPWFTWSLRPAMRLSVSGAVPIGGREGQNGNIGPAGFVRLRYSF